MSSADFLIVGGGVAGLSAAAALARHGKTLVLEAEEALGYHSSGRSATFSHYGIGGDSVRAMTRWSRGFFEGPPEGFTDVPLAHRASAIFVATAETLDRLERLELEMGRFTDSLERIGPEALNALFPPLRTGDGAIVAGSLYRDGLRLDSDALLQGYARAVRAAGGEVVAGRRVIALRREGGAWTVTSREGECWSAPILVDAAGAWADEVALLAGVAPLGLRPLRRTIVVIDPPPSADVRRWPFVKTVGDDFYILPESGRLMASPVDEVECEPCDAQPEEYDIALAAWAVETYTTLAVDRIAQRWAGLRTFAADRVPVAGFAADAPGFFRLAGQGGYGLQTAPAMAAIAEALVTGGSWPAGLAELGAGPADILPDRLAARPGPTGKP
jgi:D-arginine dehydrogenase